MVEKSQTRSNQLDPVTNSTQKPGNGRRVVTPPDPSHLSRSIRRDPAVIPLGLIVAGVIGVAGYFALNKAPKEGGGIERNPTTRSVKN
ncbi:hypothetical protein BY996DRAFT_6870389 [Phakopsora pachyrhizi]|nr:hypothetical protein BY996DRAFT_6870389 [Phakopsora pachyrhizi]